MKVVYDSVGKATLDASLASLGRRGVDGLLRQCIGITGSRRAQPIDARWVSIPDPPNAL